MTAFWKILFSWNADQSLYRLDQPILFGRSFVMFCYIGCNRFLMKIKDFAFITGSACQSQDEFIRICQNSVSMKIQFAGHLKGTDGFCHRVCEGLSCCHVCKDETGSHIIFWLVKIRFCFRGAGNCYCSSRNILWTINFCSRWKSDWKRNVFVFLPIGQLSFFRECKAMKAILFWITPV